MSVDSKMTALADEVRALSGTADTKSISEMTAEIDTANTEIQEQMDLISQIANALEGKAASSGVTLPELTSPAAESDIISGKQAINQEGDVLVGNIPTRTSSSITVSGATVTVPNGYYSSQASKTVSSATQATPSISVNANGLITASSTQTAGYVSAGTKSATKQLTTKSATTYTPTTSDQTISSSTYLTGTQTIKGDANLKSANIAEGVSIFGVTGTHSGSEDLEAELTSQEALISQLSSILDSKASGSNGSVGVETCTVTVECLAPAPEPASVWYIDGTSDLKQATFSFGSPKEIQVMKNSIVYTLDRMGVSGQAVIIETSLGRGIFVQGDANIHLV